MRPIATTLALVLSLTAAGLAQAPRPGGGPAYLVIELRTRAPIASARLDAIEQPLLAGSVMKIATLAAALESGVITDRTEILCTRQATAGDERLTCAHPDLRRPLGPAEALAHSCNVYFATVAARLSRPSLDRALASLGLATSDRSVPLSVSALGVGGARVGPRALVDMVARVAAEPTTLPWRASTLATIREGLRGAADFGTASPLKAAGIDALAKTGTILAGGRPQGIVVGVVPSTRPTTGFVLIAPGATGADAAALVAERLKPVLAPAGRPQAAAPAAASRPPAQTPSPPVLVPGLTLRIGIARAGGGYEMRTMGLEDYVAGVLAGEAVRDSSPSALEALAITVRTYALANRGRHRADGFDLCDLTHCQVLRRATPATGRAAASTAGRLLLYRGAPASVFFTASCGGRTERPSEVWPGADDPPFLPSRADDACEGMPEWSAELPAGDLARALRAGGFKGDRLRDVKITGRSPSGRVARLRVDGFTPAEISGQDLRVVVGRTLGWQHIKSTAFDVRRSGAGYRFSGHGAGHGVGLCVIGSAKLGARGQRADVILARYFPGLQIGPLPVLSVTAEAKPRVPSMAAPPPPSGVAPRTGESEVLLSLPVGDEGEGEVIHELAVRARDTLARELGVPVPRRVTLRFHPTVESYQRASGQPWYTAGATLGTEIHFVPLTVLRDRGLLELTVRHELVHVLSEPALKNRPLWVREGAAAYFAGERPLPGEPPVRAIELTGRVSCPDNGELLHPVSPGALSNAYARASACFARQVTGGRKWSDVR